MGYRFLKSRGAEEARFGALLSPRMCVVGVVCVRVRVHVCQLLVCSYVQSDV